jgi:elongation factor G
MSSYKTQSIRSVALVGHGAAGKTSLIEALLFQAEAIPSKGSVERGTTVCDFDAQEKEAGHSLTSAVVNFGYEDTHVHLIDTPGYPDFSGQAIAALAGVDTALVVINAQTGVELMTERMMRYAAERKLCRMIVINKIDADNLDLPGLVADIRERFGKQCMLLDLPAHGAADVVEVLEHDAGDADFESVAAAHRALIDQIVEEDEDLLAQYLEDGADPSAAALHAPFEKALREGHLIPILFTSAKTGAGIKELLHVLASLAPNPAEGNPPPFYKGEPGDKTEPFHAEPDTAKHVLAHVFKVVADPYMGKIGIFRVHQGTVRKDAQLFVGDSKRPFKVAHLYQLQGKDTVEVDELLPGDIGAIAKVDEIEFDGVLHDSHDEDHIHLVPLEFPKPMAGLAVETKKKGDEQRLFDILGKLAMEDPTFVVERHPTSNETVIRGLGEIHLKSKLARMASQYKLEVDTQAAAHSLLAKRLPARPRRMYRHKKQSGGAGQFGEVHLRIEPKGRGEGFEFVDAVKGGVIPGVFMAAVEKGVRQGLEGGVVAGYAVDDLKVTVFDGKTHAVDGKEVAFTIAGRKAVIEAIRGAKPIVLEPIVNIEIVLPETSIGDLTGDLSSRRGQITGTDGRGHGMAAITGEVPLAELNDYQSRLKSLTGGQGVSAQ